MTGMTEEELQKVYDAFFEDEEKVDLLNETIAALRRNLISQHLINIGMAHVLDNEWAMCEIEACMV